MSTTNINDEEIMAIISAARRLAMEAHEWLNYGELASAERLEDAINKVEALTFDYLKGLQDC